MIDRPVSGPTNRFLLPQRDRRWPRALCVALLAGVALVLVFSLVGWPRLRSTSIHYDLIALRAEVAGLAEQQRSLDAELEHLRAPGELTVRARSLGLMPPPLAVTEEQWRGQP